MYDGYALMPAAPEYGGGGLSFWDIEDPCEPEMVGFTFSDVMRETHSIGFSSQGGRWAVVDSLTSIFLPGGGGIQFWDVSDPTDPQPVSTLDFEGFLYPDAYARVTLSVFWQPPWVYVGGADNGIYVVDAGDPRNPVLVTRWSAEPVARIGQVQVVGNLLVATTAEQPETILLDVSDPAAPQEIPGGRFAALDAAENPVDSYFTNASGGHVYYTPTTARSGLVVMDIHDPEHPQAVGDFVAEGGGGYVALHEGRAFVGESNFAQIYDVSDPSRIEALVRLNLTGDLDTMYPLGNVAVLSVDEDATPGQASAVVPWATRPDRTPPRVTWAWPPDGAERLPPGSRFGVTFSESVDVKSVWEGSVRLYEEGTDPDATRVPGIASAQETIVNFTPAVPLRPATRYVLEISAGGVVDFSGNAIEEAYRATFTTAGG
jgi:hypothetical protein